ncbi:MAG TPA: Rieske 2Fe-2S domain-containing protein [Stellaceae bacterium]|nr:Rieske 2Fe-2S domain-containing protein [Stellaceae bacterium]
MSAGFRAVQWNRTKLVYDLVMLAGVGLYITTFLEASLWLGPAQHPVTWEILRIRAFGTCAFLMLTIVLAIGPLARLDRRFLPFLYNRRHFGVTLFCVAALHAWFVLDWYHSEGRLPELVSVLVGNRHYASFIDFPFEALGIVALLWLFLMAATSHDYWLAFLGPPLWKALHMGVYLVYGLLVMHVALGVMQTERSPVVPLLLGGSFAGVAALHLVAGRREGRVDRARLAAPWITVGPPNALPDGAGCIVVGGNGERIAVFRDGRRVGALTNLCAHQNGPLGEGRIIDGCVTCPWHGFQYQLADGRSPPPFTEKVATHRVRLNGGIVEVEAAPQPPGTELALLEIGEPHG